MQRRDFLKGSLAAAACALLNPELNNNLLHAEEAEELSYADALELFTDGEEVSDGSSMMKLNIPDAPPSGATVPVEVTIDHPMDENNYIESIAVFTTKNKANKVISADLTPANGIAYLYVNAKLGQTQDVVVVAKTSEGKFYKASKSVKIALGGCG